MLATCMCKTNVGTTIKKQQRNTRLKWWKAIYSGPMVQLSFVGIRCNYFGKVHAIKIFVHIWNHLIRAMNEESPDCDWGTVLAWPPAEWFSVQGSYSVRTSPHLLLLSPADHGCCVEWKTCLCLLGPCTVWPSEWHNDENELIVHSIEPVCISPQNIPQAYGMV